MGNRLSSNKPRGYFVDQTPGHRSTIVAMPDPFGNKVIVAEFKIVAHIFDLNYRYRQYVKGFFKLNGNEQMHELIDGYLNTTTFLEDRDKDGGYGDDKNIQFKSTYHNKDGCRLFETWDTPQQSFEAGQSVEIDLHFKGVIVSKSDSQIADTRT